MKLSILFDLDDTLIGDFTEKFMPAYLIALDGCVEGLPPKTVLPAVMSATDKMVRKQDVTGTLQECFDWSFYRKLELPKKELLQTFERFYEEEFPGLKKHLTKLEWVNAAMQEILEDGHDVVIATNPLFPEIATYSRVEWAGLGDLAASKIKLITTYEEFHFCKPHIEYYAEVLGRMGWQDQPVVMIGDNFDMDIAPVEKLGIPAYWISDKENGFERHPAGGKGHRKGFIGWIKDISAGDHVFNLNSFEMILPTLNSTPAVLDGYARAFVNEELKLKEIDQCAVRLFQTDKEILKRLTGNDEYLGDGNEQSEFEIAARKKLSNALADLFEIRGILLREIMKTPQQNWGGVRLTDGENLDSIFRQAAASDRQMINRLHKKLFA